MGHLLDWLARLPAGAVLLAAFLFPLLEASAFVGFVFPGEIAVLIAGVDANQGALPLWLVIVVASAGAILGDSIGYEVGKHYGERLLNRLPQRVVKPQHIERTKALLRRRGGAAVFIGRFTAALRVLVPGMAGMSGLPYRQFLLFNALGGIAWASQTALVGYLVGKSYRAAEHRLSVIGFGLLALIIGGYLVLRLRRHPAVARFLAQRWSNRRWTGRPLTLAVAAAVISGWLFGGILQDVLAGDGAAAHDPHWHQVLVHHRIAAVSAFARVYTNLGPVGFAVLFIVVVFVVRRKRYAEAVLAVAALIAGQFIRTAISILVHRPRPPQADWLVGARGYAFPSGHTTTAVLVCGLAVALAWPWLPERTHRIAAVAAATVIALLAGAARAYLGVHWPTDVLGGWALGALLLTPAIAGLSLLRFRSQPTPEHRRSAISGRPSGP